MPESKFVSRKEARERISSAMLSCSSEHIRPPTRRDRELLAQYGIGPTYQPGTRYLSGVGYNPFIESIAGPDLPALLRAQSRHRDWQWHRDRVEDVVRGFFQGRRCDRAEFEAAFARFDPGRNTIRARPRASAEEVLLDLLPDLRGSDVPLIPLPDKNDVPNTEPSNAAWHAMQAIWPKGIAADKKTSEITIAINRWIKKQPRNLVARERVSAETVRRLLGRRKPQKSSLAGNRAKTPNS